MGVLVLFCLALIPVSFRSSALDGVQGTGPSILQPFEVAANRVAAPFRDAAGWAHGLVNAKNQNKKLRRENQQLQQKLIYDEQAVQENVQLRAQLDFKGVPGLDKFNRVNTEVQTNPQNAIDQRGRLPPAVEWHRCRRCRRLAQAGSSGSSTRHSAASRA